MKRKLLLIAAVMSTLLAQAKDHTVVVKNDPHLPKGHTEVKIDPGIESDSVIITPGIHVTDIEVTIKNTEGSTIAQYWLPTNTPIPLGIKTSDLPEGYVIEVKDNDGFVFSRKE